MASLGISVEEMDAYHGFPWQDTYRYAWEKVPVDYARALRRLTTVDKTIQMHRQGIPLEYAVQLMTD